MKQNSFFREVKKKLGFGCLRLPMNGSEINYEELNRMVDYFLESGFNYFDTAHPYINELSETALRECLVTRYPRDRYFLVNKLSEEYFNNEEEILPLFKTQLERCGVEYFDGYLMQAQIASSYAKFKKCRAYETALKLKEEGKIHHFGISFHDHARVLEQILSEYPQIEFVQIQFNYADYNDPGIESHKCYDVCLKHGKPVVVMEPVKGGVLQNLPEDASKVFDDLGRNGSNASYAIRYAATPDDVKMVLSGMSNLNQMIDNISFMKDFKPLNDAELQAVKKVSKILHSKKLIPCTACHYCTAGCPKQIPIPDLFADMNARKLYQDWNSDWYYLVHTTDHGKASDCIQCGRCEKICPQHLPIRQYMKDVAAEMEREGIEMP